MKLIEALIGTRAERQASNVISKLSKKPQPLSERDQARFDRDKEVYGKLVTRRKLIGGGVVIGTGVIAILGLAGHTWYSSNQFDRLIQDINTKEKETAPLIVNMEAGFMSFHQRVNQAMDDANTPQGIRQLLSVPFDLVQTNTQNPDRNFYTAIRKETESKKNGQDPKTHIVDRNFFFYDIRALGNVDDYASFNSETRTLVVRPSHQPTNLLDNAILYHEVVHTGQDNEDRKTFTLEQYTAAKEYIKVQAPNRGVVATYEATAIAYEVFLVNLLTQGQLREDSLRGVMDREKYLRSLNVPPNKAQQILRIGEFASYFFKSDSTVDNLKPSYVDFVAKFYRDGGSKIFDRTPSGFIVRPT